MKKIIATSTLTSLLLTSAAYAVEVTGGYVDLGYSTFTDSDLGDVYNLNGAGELAFSRVFSLQLDAGGYRFEDEDYNGTNVTLHANLHTQTASFGAFYGQDHIEDETFQFYGVEAGFGAGPAQIEGYLGFQDLKEASGADGAILGISAGGAVNDKWTVIGKYDYLNDIEGALDVSAFSIGATYNVGTNAQVYGEFGAAHLSIGSASSTEPFLGAGVRINLGNERGTTFGRRGVLDKLPGL